MLQNIKECKKILDQLSYILTKEQKRASVAVFISIIAASLMELLGVSVFYPFLQMMVDADNLRGKWYVEILDSVFPTMSDTFLLMLMALMFILVYFLKNIVIMVAVRIQLSFAAQFRKDCAKTIMDSFMRRPYEYFVNTNSSIILRSIGWDTASVYAILTGFFNLINDVFTVLLLAIYLIIKDPVIAFGALTLALLCLVVVVFGMRKRVKEAGNISRDKGAEKNQIAYQTIMGAKEITVMGRKDLFVGQFHEANEEYEEIVKDYSFITAIPARVIEVVCITGLMGIVCVRIALGVDMSTFIPVLGTFAMCAFKIMPALSTISNRINTLLYNRPGLESIYDNLKEIESIDAKMQEWEAAAAQQVGSEENLEKISFKDKVEIRDISWHYLNIKDNVLENLSMTIKKGQSVALIGPSGAGKTTLADVILGLLHPQTGSVEMDGVDIYSMPKQWCHIIGYVPQTVFLLDDTVRANIAFGLPAELVTDEKIWHALEQAQLKTFVEGLPQGLDTMVGERGVKFSGGQRQRIAIARALYEDPDILVLDEATSALDTETETAVMESIDALQGVKTLIIVAHRLTTIRNCDCIYEIRDGKATLKVKEEVFG